MHGVSYYCVVVTWDFDSGDSAGASVRTCLERYLGVKLIFMFFLYVKIGGRISRSVSGVSSQAPEQCIDIEP
jgi:hypothetical protein